MKGQQETDEKSRARDLLMRKLAVFRSKTDPKTLHVSRNLTEITLWRVRWFRGTDLLFTGSQCKLCETQQRRLWVKAFN